MLLKEVGDYFFANKKLPRVKVDKPVRHSSVTTGKVTSIKIFEHDAICGVRFDDLNYDSWFWHNEKKDKRSKYMSQLTIDE